MIGAVIGAGALGGFMMEGGCHPWGCPGAELRSGASALISGLVGLFWGVPTRYRCKLFK